MMIEMWVPSMSPFFAIAFPPDPLKKEKERKSTVEFTWLMYKQMAKN